VQPPQDAARQRLEILDAVIAAIERRVEVFDLMAGSSSAEEAHSRLAVLLGTSDIGTVAVLDLQARRFTTQDRQRIVDEQAELRRSLGK
jgi:DNA gyrase/topoisomerase IV subunit A